MPRRLTPFLLAVAIISSVGVVALVTRGFERLEWITYDWRVRQAAGAESALVATNLGFVDIRNETIEAMLHGELGFRAGLYWPRHVYGRLVKELSDEGARAVGLDVLFAELRPDHPPAELPDGAEEMSDYFFSRQLRDAGRVVLGADKGTLPAEVFRTNAWALGDISAARDADGVLRRSQAWVDYYDWHPLLRATARRLNLDLREPRFDAGRLVLSSPGGTAKIIPLDVANRFDQVALFEEQQGAKAPANAPRFDTAFTRFRVWDLGITLAARELGLDLDRAQIEPERGRVVLRGAGGVERVIPVDRDGWFHIPWTLTPFDPRITKEPMEHVLYRAKLRQEGQTNPPAPWRDKLVFVGSTASGNDLTDLGATPLEKETYLTSRLLNVANAVLTGQFIRPCPRTVELALVVALGLLGAGLTLTLRPPVAVGVVALAAAGWFAAGLALYVRARLWLPEVAPLASLLGTHFGLVAYRAFFEQNERRRIRGVFSKIVAPEIVHELLRAEKLSLGGARRHVTVMFADVRGFTEMTDESHARAEEHVRAHGLAGAAAEAHFDARSREALATVNLYLATIADIVKRHGGTLDKYIGDCVMAFWGAPVPNARHAAACVRAAVEARQAITALNARRTAENANHDPGQPPLKILHIGTGIHTGMVTIGLMGSDAHIVNFTVFGRDVNLASRLEGLAGRGQILLGETTHRELLRDEPDLAAACAELPPATVKGIVGAVRVWEVGNVEALKHGACRLS